MAEQKTPEQNDTKEEKAKNPSMGDRTKDVLKDEAARAARRGGRSLLYNIFGSNISRIIRLLFG